MKIIKIKKIGDCLEGSNVRDILLDNTVDKKFIEYIGELGKLIYNSSMDKPFYKVIVRGQYTLKGAETNKTIRVLLPEGVDENGMKSLIDHIRNSES